MCFSAEASYISAALLLPAGLVSVTKAYRTDRRYLAISALPFLFGLQQLFEAMVWTAGAVHDSETVTRYSLAYMFFSWLAWPVWVPVSVYFMEPNRRKPLFLAFALLGAVFGGAEYLPYLAHEGWLTVTFLPHAIVYGGTELFDFLASRYFSYSLYVTAVIIPLLLSSKPEIKIFGVLVAVVLVITYNFFWYAYVSVFCFGGALMSFYLVGMIFWIGRRPLRATRHDPGLQHPGHLGIS